MVKASELFKRGEFNLCTMEYDAVKDVRTVTIFKFGWKKPRKFKVKKLGQKDEEILEDEEEK